jgi:DNA-binding transcriptional LysR family regulator
VDNLAGIDLNLLVAFDALLSERSVTRAAQRLGLSQPAVSNALSRLRDLLNDRVLVRTGRGMEPTARALELADPIQQFLSGVRQALAPPAFFNPQTSTQRFSVQTADHVELSLLPRLVERLTFVAPRVDLALLRASRGIEDDLRTGRVDLYLGTWSKPPASLHQHLLCHDGFACIARRGHPRLKSRLSLRAYAEFGHVLISSDERPSGVIETALLDQGLDRRIVVRTAGLLLAAVIVARSDLMATVPRTAAETLAKLLPLNVFRPPVDVSSVPIHMVWHTRTHEQAPFRWLRDLIMEIATDGNW